MIRLFVGEVFKEVTFDDSLKFRYAISNFGRFVSFSQDIEKDGRLLKGSTVEGYRIFRYKIFGGPKIINRHAFFFHMVAEQFLLKPSTEHNHVIHVDYNKTNDHFANLKWVTKEQMVAHQKGSPAVQKAKEKLVEFNKKRDGQKLTSTEVILLKRKLADPKRKTRLKMLAKQFGISEMQLYRNKS
mgnify:FL=1